MTDSPRAAEEEPLVRPASQKKRDKVKQYVKDIAGDSVDIESTTDYVFEKYLVAKNATKAQHWSISVVIILSAFAVFWAGIFRIFECVIFLHPVEAIIEFYQVLFAATTFFFEILRYLNLFGIRATAMYWFKFMETTLGRGALQLLTGCLAVSGWNHVTEWLPGLVLCFFGGICFFYGFISFYRLNAARSEVRNHERRNSERLEGLEEAGKRPMMSPVDYALNKFEQLDIMGTGKLHSDVLMSMCKELNIEVSEEDTNAIEAQFKDKDDQITLKDFQKWWLKKRGMNLFRKLGAHDNV